MHVAAHRSLDAVVRFRFKTSHRKLSVSQWVQVASRECDWLSIHLALDTLATCVTASPSATTQALACPLLETLANLLAALAVHIQARTATEPPAPGTPLQMDTPRTPPGQKDASAHPATPSTAAHPQASPSHFNHVVTGSKGIFASELDLGDQLDWGLVLKVVRFVSYLAGCAPAHRDAFVQLGAVAAMLELLRTCASAPAIINSTPATPSTHNVRISPTCAAEQQPSRPKAVGRAQQPVAEVLLDGLWCLVRLAEDSPEGQKAVLLADGPARLAECATSYTIMVVAEARTRIGAILKHNQSHTLYTYLLRLPLTGGAKTDLD